MSDSHNPLVLDLFCGQGGAARGYADAGFDVIGVDTQPQPRYPFRAVRAEAWKVLTALIKGSWRGFTLRDFALIHASCPCQAYCDLNKRNRVTHQDLVDKTRSLLKETQRPYVIENVPEAPLINPFILCGTMFHGLKVIRHRAFETNFKVTPPPHPPGRHPLVDTHHKGRKHYATPQEYVTVTGGGNCTAERAREAMGIPWMTKTGLNEAVPPSYTEFIGLQLRGGR